MTGRAIWAVIPAAGSGSRFGADVPKQYLTVNGSTVLEIAVERLLRCPGMQRVIVAVNAADERWRALPLLADRRVQTVAGGAERADSVLAGLHALAGNAGSDDWVLVHDAARPCVAVQSIEAMLAELAAHPVGGIMAVPVADTLKRADADNHIGETVDRDGLWAAQTPQLFRYGLLLQALESALADKAAITDEASAMERAGHRAALYPGDSSNIKITRPADLALARLILEAQSLD